MPTSLSAEGILLLPELIHQESDLLDKGSSSARTINVLMISGVVGAELVTHLARGQQLATGRSRNAARQLRQDRGETAAVRRGHTWADF